MKKILVAASLAFALAPCAAFAAPISADYFTATDTAATSTFAGNVSVGGLFDFGLGKGILSIIDGILSLTNLNAGGSLNIQTNNTSSTDVGFIQLIGGSATSGDAYGGGVVISAGDSSGARPGGDVTIASGFGGETGDGGFIQVVASSGGTTSGRGGGIFIAGGNSRGGNGDGGSIFIEPGLNDGSGAIGTIQFENILSNRAAIWDTSVLADTDKTFTLPNVSGTLGLLEAGQTWSGENTFSKGASATTTVTFGKLGDSSSKSCFNTKNTDGDDISFYFAGTAMVVENNTCK